MLLLKIFKILSLEYCQDVAGLKRSSPGYIKYSGIHHFMVEVFITMISRLVLRFWFRITSVMFEAIHPFQSHW